MSREHGRGHPTVLTPDEEREIVEACRFCRVGVWSGKKGSRGNYSKLFINKKKLKIHLKMGYLERDGRVGL